MRERFRSGVSGPLIGAVLCAAPAAAFAADTERRFELAPYAGVRFGGAFEAEAGEDFDLERNEAKGLLFNMTTATGDTQWEVLYARQRTRIETQPAFETGPLLDIDADYLQAGGTYLFDAGDTQPFVALTAGIGRFAPGPPGFDDELYLSGSLGGGVHLRARDRIGVRIEGRVFASFIDTDGELFCRGGAHSESSAYTCALAADSDTLVQWETRIGLVFRF